MRFSSTVRRVLGSSLALLLFAGCSGGGSQSSALPGQPTRSLSVGQTLPLSVASQSGIANSATSRITTCPKERVYVSNYGFGDIEIYPRDWATSPAPCATITHDTLGPSGLSVDKNGTLYVTNFCCDAISVFPRDARSPSRMIVTAKQPNYVYVGADGTVYSSEWAQTQDQTQVEEFAAGATSATRTLSVPGSSGIATDSKNNLYVVSTVFTGTQFVSRVLKFAPGATTGTDLGLQISGAEGIAVTKNDSLVVGDGQIDIFPPRAKVPSRSFKTIDPFDFALSRWETKLYVASSSASGVAEYDFQSGTLLGTITAGLSEPDGAAYDPADP